MNSEERIEYLCEVMHDAYETAAVEVGWETQARSRKPWADVPEANKRTMRLAVQAMLATLPELLTDERVVEASVQSLRDRGLIERYAQDDARAVLNATAQTLAGVS
jgi:hypothetical protein